MTFGHYYLLLQDPVLLLDKVLVKANIALKGIEGGLKSVSDSSKALEDLSGQIQRFFIEKALELVQLVVERGVEFETSQYACIVIKGIIDLGANWF